MSIFNCYEHNFYSIRVKRFVPPLFPWRGPFKFEAYLVLISCQRIRLEIWQLPHHSHLFTTSKLVMYFSFLLNNKRSHFTLTWKLRIREYIPVVHVYICSIYSLLSLKFIQNPLNHEYLIFLGSTSLIVKIHLLKVIKRETYYLNLISCIYNACPYHLSLVDGTMISFFIEYLTL